MKSPFRSAVRASGDARLAVHALAAAVFAIGLVGGRPALAQISPAMERSQRDLNALPVSIGGACPSAATPRLASSIPFDALRRKYERGGPRQIVVEEAVVYSDPRLRVAIPELTLPFKTQVKVLHWDKGPAGAHFIKLDTSKGARCGWVVNTALLPEERVGPLTVKALHDAGLEGFNRQDGGGRLYAKVLVARRADSESDLQPEKSGGVGVYYDPSDPLPYMRLRLFNVLHVHAYRNKDHESWYLVGGERASPSSQAEPVIHGWVRADDVVPWTTRASLRPVEGKRPLPLFGTESDALDDRRPIGQLSALSNRPNGRHPSAFPLLDTREGRAANGRTWTLHQIALPATVCFDPDRRGLCAGARSVAARHETLADEQQRARHIDFLFVIDATESMGRYFRPIGQGIQGFLDGIDATAAEPVHFSVVAFGDFADNDGHADTSFQFDTLVPFGPADSSRIATKLGELRTYRDPMRDYPEAGFAALARAADEARWRKNAGWRVVIWIGDHPNRDREHSNNRPAAFDVDDVARAIQQAGALWAAINVRGNAGMDQNRRFIAQADAILDALGDWGADVRVAYRGSRGRESSRLIKTAVQETLREVYDSAQEVLQTFDFWTVGQELSAVDAAGILPSGKLARRYLQETKPLNGVSLSKLLGVPERLLSVWVRQPKKPPFQHRYWLALEPSAMRNIITAVRGVCRSLHQAPPAVDLLREAMAETVQGVVADELPRSSPRGKTNIRQFLARRLLVPTDQFSAILDTHPAGFAAWTTDQIREGQGEKWWNTGWRRLAAWISGEPTVEDAVALRVQVCQGAAVLALARQGKRLPNDQDDLEHDPASHDWRAKSGRVEDFNWMWGRDPGVSHFYIPLDYLF